MNGVQWNIGMVLDGCNGRQAHWLGKVKSIGGVSLVVVVGVGGRDLKLSCVVCSRSIDLKEN